MKDIQGDMEIIKTIDLECFFKREQVLNEN